MASEGRLVFADGAAAARGIQALTHQLRSIDLHCGGDLRIDVLLSDLAVPGCPYTEVLTGTDGHVREDSGYLTGLAHWSTTPP